MVLQTAFRMMAADLWMPVVAALALAMSGANASAQGDKPVMTINSEVIPESEFYHRLQLVKGADFLLPTNPPTMRGEHAGYIVLNSIINERLILQLAAKANMMPTDAEVDEDLKTLKKQDAIIQALQSKTVSEDDLKYDIKVQLARYYLATLRQKATPEEVEAYYNAHLDNYRSPERWGLSAIRTSKVEDAIKVENELKAGKSFEETARVYSDDERSRATGGKIGVFDASDKGLPEEIRKSVSTLKVGEHTEQPLGVEFDPGGGKPKQLVYWIVKLMTKMDASIRQLADVRPLVERLATLQKVGGLEVADKKIADFRKTSMVTINLPGYEELTKQK